MKKIMIPLMVIVLLAVAAAMYLRKSNEQPISYRTGAISRGDLAITISATGTVEPEEVIDVGAQIAGQILEFGKDKTGKPIDYGSGVEAGTVLAKIDDAMYAADAAQAAALVEVNKAMLKGAEANLEQLAAKLDEARRDWQRAQKLGPSEALAVTSYDAYRAAYETAMANVDVGKAAIMQSKASVVQSQAAFKKAQNSLSYCTIKSPVKGVIIDRRVNIGQTVVSSLSAPSLFLIAKDLKRMQVWVAVNEADIGKIHPGLPVSFTVDAFPGETFRGEVGKVRLNASMTQNVVTYTVEVVTDNSTGRLLPYLTANVSFELQHLKGVLLAPNAALRWMPTVEQVAPEFRGTSEKAAGAKGKGKAGQKPEAKPDNGVSAGQKHGILWVQQGAFVAPVFVKAGLSDGVMTQVQGEGLKDGMLVVLGQQSQAAGPASTANPFRRGRTGGH
jgi:HlyD family secretion protein